MALAPVSFRASRSAGAYPPCHPVGLEVDLNCPRCGERVLDTERYVVGQDRARRQRATCPQCHAELVRGRDPGDKTWKVEDPTPPPDEERAPATSRRHARTSQGSPGSCRAGGDPHWRTRSSASAATGAHRRVCCVVDAPVSLTQPLRSKAPVRDLTGRTARAGSRASARTADRRVDWPAVKRVRAERWRPVGKRLCGDG